MNQNKLNGVCAVESHDEMLKYRPLAWTHAWKYLRHSSSS